MNLKFIERGKAGYKVVEFGGVGVAYKEVVYSKGESGGVGVVAEEHRGGGFIAVLCEEGDKAKLRQEPRLGKTRHSFEDITEDEGFVVGVSEEG